MYFGFSAVIVSEYFLLLFAGFKKDGFALDTVVLSTLVGSTAVAAIGLVYTVVKGLFGPITPKA
jgi:hypothetical protein